MRSPQQRTVRRASSAKNLHADFRGSIEDRVGSIVERKELRDEGK